MDTDEQAVAAGLKRLRINKQLSAVKVALGPLGFGEDLSCDSLGPGHLARCQWMISLDVFRESGSLPGVTACGPLLSLANMQGSSRGLCDVAMPCRPAKRLQPAL